jgi:hypothetical protein
MGALAPAQAQAGGWWTTPQVAPHTAAVGQRVEVRATVLFASAEAANAAREERFAIYLLDGFNHSILERAMRRATPGRGDWWSLGDAEPLEVGRLSLTVSRNTGVVRGSFRVPRLPRGGYAVMLCDTGCRRPLGDSVPRLGFTVVADPVTARVSAQIEHLTDRLAVQTGKLTAARAALSGGRGRVAALARDVERLRGEVDAVRREVSAADARAAGRSKMLAWFAGGVIVALSAALALAWRRRRRARWDAALATLLAGSDPHASLDRVDQSIVK